MVKNMVISVDEGMLNSMGMTTGYPMVESVMEGMEMVGVLVELLAAMTVMVTGSCLLYTSPSPRDLSTSRMPSSA